MVPKENPPILPKMRAFALLAAAVTGVAAVDNAFAGAAPVDEEEKEIRLMKLGPIMEKLRGLDPKRFGKLGQMVESVESAHAFLQENSPEDDSSAMEERLVALGPVMEKLRSLDPKMFGKLNTWVLVLHFCFLCGILWAHHSAEPGFWQS